MPRRYRPSQASPTEAGFTLIEIIIAVLVLATALVTLLGLQAAAVERTIRDNNKQRAMFIARTILAAIESSEEPIEPQDLSAPAADVIKKLAPEDSTDRDFLQEISQFDAHFVVENWELPDIDPKALKRVTLTISWSPAFQDSFQVNYFIPEEAEEEDSTP